MAVWPDRRSPRSSSSIKQKLPASIRSRAKMRLKSVGWWRKKKKANRKMTFLSEPNEEEVADLLNDEEEIERNHLFGC